MQLKYLEINKQKGAPSGQGLDTGREEVVC